MRVCVRMYVRVCATHPHTYSRPYKPTHPITLTRRHIHTPTHLHTRTRTHTSSLVHTHTYAHICKHCSLAQKVSKEQGITVLGVCVVIELGQVLTAFIGGNNARERRQTYLYLHRPSTPHSSNTAHTHAHAQLGKRVLVYLLHIMRSKIRLE